MELVTVVVLVSAFFSLGLLITVYIRHGARSRIRGGGALNTTFLFGGGTAAFGVADDVIRRLPTFRYSGLTIGKGSLECAVCLTDFVGEELLRQLPKCGHVFHSHCVDAWLSAHTTCPLCRASLVPGPAQDFNFTTVQMSDPEINTDIQNQEPELRSLEMPTSGLYPRSHSTGRSLVQLGEIHEGLADEVREEDIETHEES